MVEPFEDRVIVVIELWEMNDALRQALHEQTLPVAATTSAEQSVACTALRTAAYTSREPVIAPAIVAEMAAAD